MSALKGSRFNRTLHFIFVVISVLTVSIYLSVRFNIAQRIMEHNISASLSELLHTDVEIDEIEISGFNQVAINHFLLKDQSGDTLLFVRRAMMGFEILPLLRGDIHISTIQVIGGALNVRLPSKDSLSNAHFIVDALAPRQSDRQRRFINDLHINSIGIRQSRFSYDVLDAPFRNDRLDNNHIHIQNISANIRHFEISLQKKMSLQLRRLKMNEQSGITLHQAESHIDIEPSLTELTGVNIRLNNSTLSAEHLYVDNHMMSTLKNFRTERRLIETSDLQLKLTPEDFNLFFGEQNHITQPLYISSDIVGTNRSIGIPSLQMQFTDNLTLNASISLLNPYALADTTGQISPDMTFWNADIRQCEASPEAVNIALRGILDSKTYRTISAAVNRVGNIGFVGQCEGTPRSLSASGQLSTAKAGSISSHNVVHHYLRTPILEVIPFEKAPLNIESHIETDHLHMGRIVNHRQAGRLNAHANINYRRESDDSFNTSLEGSVSRFDWAGYTYHNISFNTTLLPSNYAGALYIEDPEGTISIEGSSLWADTLKSVEIEARISDFFPHRLNLTDITYLENIGISAHIANKMQFRSWDDINGYLDIDQLEFSSPVDTLRPTPFNITSLCNADSSRIDVSSPIFAMSYQGSERISLMVREVKKFFRTHLPTTSDDATTLASKDKTSSASKKSAQVEESESPLFTLQGRIPESRYISHFFGLPCSIGRDVTFYGNMGHADSSFYAEVTVPHLQYNNYIVRGLSGTLENRQDSEGNSFLFCAGDGICDIDHKNFEAHFSGQFLHGDLLSTLLLDYTSPDNKVHSVVDITTDRASLMGETRTVRLNSRLLDVNGEQWTTSPFLLTNHVETGEWQLEGALLQSHQEKPRHLSIAAHLNGEKKPRLDLKMQNVELQHIFDFIGGKYLTFGGSTTGALSFNLQDSIPRMWADSLDIRDFAYQRCLLGDAIYSVKWDMQKNCLSMHCDVENHDTERQSSAIDAEVYLRPRGVKDSLSLHFDTHRLPVDFLSFWLGGFMTDFKGYATGDVRIFGATNTLRLEGTPYLSDVSFSNGFLGANFSFSDTIYLTTSPSFEEASSASTQNTGRILLDNISISDASGKTARLTADVSHRYLSDIRYRVDLDIPTYPNTGFLIYNHPFKPDAASFWGQLYVSGACRLTGDLSHHNINVSARTAGQSRFFISPSENTISENNYNFLTFRDNTPRPIEPIGVGLPFMSSGKKNTTSTTSASDNYIVADLMLHLTPGCRIDLLMDPLADDRLRCQGEGDINIKYDSRTQLTILGSYDMNQGKYTITMPGDMMTKDFNIENGSSVTFSGNPENANLNINAAYSIPSVNLTDLDESFATLSSMSRTTVPVDCKLLVTGELSAPQIAFDVEVQRVSADVQAMVRNIIGTSDMMSRQVFYLLLFNRFYTPEYASTTNSHNGTEIASFASASLTSQLNNLLGQMSEYVSIGTHFRSDKGDFSDMEMDLALSTRLLGNRLILGGNFGYRDRAHSIGLANTSNFIGDFDIEYLINPSGTFRFKAYSHYNERDYSINNALTTQGAGFVIRREYDSFKDLFRWLKREKK